MKIKFLTPLFFLCFSFLNAQEVEFSGSFNTKGLIYSEDESPFWMHSNQQGRVDELSNFSGWINGQAKYQISENAGLELGFGVLYQDGYTDKLQLDESYLAFENSWLSIVAGRKQRAELYNGLSASNQNILWSLNARPLPGIQISTTRPIFFKNNKGIGFKATLEEYLMDDERYVDNTRLHHKSFHLVYKTSENFQVTAGLQHFVQWGGTSPDFGQLPDSFSDYINVVTGKEGDDTVGGQEANALGNHLGSYEVYIDTKIADYNVQFIYNHLFEDGSGRVLRNTPDGRYGIYVEDPNPGKWVDAFIYEFYYTKDQSDTDITTDGEDNYFNNNLYRSG
ncbi:MAG: capsule assembly Wzi family protein [Bacteroidota bacterium]